MNKEKYMQTQLYLCYGRKLLIIMLKHLMKAVLPHSSSELNILRLI